jgi:hypothetical protein
MSIKNNTKNVSPSSQIATVLGEGLLSSLIWDVLGKNEPANDNEPKKTTAHREGALRRHAERKAKGLPWAPKAAMWTIARNGKNLAKPIWNLSAWCEHKGIDYMSFYNGEEINGYQLIGKVERVA